LIKVGIGIDWWKADVFNVFVRGRYLFLKVGVLPRAVVVICAIGIVDHCGNIVINIE